MSGEVEVTHVEDGDGVYDAITRVNTQFPHLADSVEILLHKGLERALVYTGDPMFAARFYPRVMAHLQEAVLEAATKAQNALNCPDDDVIEDD